MGYANISNAKAPRKTVERNIAFRRKSPLSPVSSRKCKRGFSLYLKMPDAIYACCQLSRPNTEHETHTPDIRSTLRLGGPSSAQIYDLVV